MIFMYLLFLCCLSPCAADLCNWSGSGLAREAEANSRTVQQVRLRCTEGSVEWVYPGQALRVVLEPNLSSARHTTVCIKPFRSFHGASVYIERAGELDLLMTDGGRPEQVFCFPVDGPQKPAIFLLANPQSDISRRAWFADPSGTYPTMLSGRHHWWRSQRGGCTGSVAGCSSATTGTIGVPGSSSTWHGHIHTLLQCHVKPGGGEFLFTGTEHFGEAWLGCAPRYKDFLSLYQSAWAARQNPCEFPLD
ncbi:unnamed protein product [Coregonus sp. 'balchen']|nr:unnamed protein product [Coregonus sp. 'balchen']